MRTFLLFLLGLIVRLVLLFAIDEYHEPMLSEQRNIVLSIIQGQGYANPYIMPTGVTAHSPPLYTIFWAGLFSLFGTDRAGELALHVVNASAASLAFALLPMVAKATSLPPSTGVIAALVGNLVPVHLLLEINMGEAAFSALLLISLFLATVCLPQKSNITAKTGVRHGLVWGVTFLLNPSLLSVCLTWLLLGLWTLRSKMFVYTGALIATAGMVLLPWTLRNMFVLGSPLFVRSNFGLELQMANNELAFPRSFDMFSAGGAYEVYHPVSSKAEAQRVLSLGEVEYNRDKLHQALNWIRDNPATFALLTFRRMLLFWFPTPHPGHGAFGPVQALVLWPVTALGFVGLLLARRQGRLIAAMWLVYPLIYYTMQGDNRYKYPIFWSIVLLAAFAVRKISSVVAVRFGSAHWQRPAGARPKDKRSTLRSRRIES